MTNHTTSSQQQVGETAAPDPLAYGPTGYRCGCGKDAHSNLVPCQPDQPQPDHRPASTA